MDEYYQILNEYGDVRLASAIRAEHARLAGLVRGLHKEIPNSLGYRNCLEVFKSLCENCSDEQQQPVAYPCRGLSDVLALLTEGEGE